MAISSEGKGFLLLANVVPHPVQEGNGTHGFAVWTGAKQAAFRQNLLDARVALPYCTKGFAAAGRMRPGSFRNWSSFYVFRVF